MLLFAVVCFVILLFALGHQEDKGCSLGQRLICSQFRFSRWMYAMGESWNVFLVHYRAGREAQRKAYADAMDTALPELLTPRKQATSQYNGLHPAAETNSV